MVLVLFIYKHLGQTIVSRGPSIRFHSRLTSNWSCSVFMLGSCSGASLMMQPHLSRLSPAYRTCRPPTQYIAISKTPFTNGGTQAVFRSQFGLVTVSIRGVLRFLNRKISEIQWAEAAHIHQFSSRCRFAKLSFTLSFSTEFHVTYCLCPNFVIIRPLNAPITCNDYICALFILAVPYASRC